MKSVPKDLLDAVGNLLDDPIYSDVEFVLPSRSFDGSKPKPRTIWAARRLLKRAEYFEASEPSYRNHTCRSLMYSRSV